MYIYSVPVLFRFGVVLKKHFKNPEGMLIPEYTVYGVLAEFKTDYVTKVLLTVQGYV
jgi:hypothetical protein